MIKNALIAAMMMGLVYAGQNEMVVTAPAPAPVSEVSPWSLELGMGSNFGLNKAIKSDYLTKKNHINTLSWDVTGVYNLNENHAITLRFAYGYGRDKFAVVPDYEGMTGTYREPNMHVRETIHQFSLMPGYRYTLPVADRWAVYAGANVGLSNESFKLDFHEDFDRKSSYTVSGHDTAWGFAYSVEIGAKYAITENLYAFGAATWSGTTAKTKVKFDGETVAKGNRHGYIGVRVGVGYSF